MLPYFLIFPRPSPFHSTLFVFSAFIAGLDVHRRVHAYAMRQLAYQVQWRAYCERCEPSAFAAFNPPTSCLPPLRSLPPPPLSFMFFSSRALCTGETLTESGLMNHHITAGPSAIGATP